MTKVGKEQHQALAQAIGRARKAAGFTQQELCTKANLSYSTLAKIERGAIKTPSVFTVVTIANATDTTVEELTGIGSANAPLPRVPRIDYKTSKTGIKFVYFDINGVLVRFFQRAFTQISADTGASADSVEAMFWHYNDIVNKGELSIDKFNELLAKRIGVEQIDWAEYYLNSIEVIPGMAEFVKWTAEHYRVGLISNIMPGLITKMIQRGILPDVDYATIIDSSEVKYIKPEREIFEIGQDKAGVKANEILFIDDSRSIIMAAERIGWHVQWFDAYRPDEGIKRIENSLAF